MNSNKIKITLLLLFVFAFSAITYAVELKSEGRDSAYVETIKVRSQKIVDKLGIKNPGTATNVRNILANRYFELNDIYEARDQANKEIDNIKILFSAEQKKAEKEKILQKTDSEIFRSHFAFISALMQHVDNQQIDKVKDEMTYGVLMVTYTATLEMIPSLKEDEKKQIYAWLWEARELAMNAESSNKKHGVFGKYKGRINNYLSARGYNLTEERKAWEQRIKAKEAKKGKK
ncbi:MAG: DUF3826 domain-containing protein [Porphyromonadaceae bacterium]|jgi:hypothetical protein|nr:DUF3826 domain-containing protein [Porphyromonadaceae bacterium]